MIITRDTPEMLQSFRLLLRLTFGSHFRVQTFKKYYWARARYRRDFPVTIFSSGACAEWNFCPRLWVKQSCIRAGRSRVGWSGAHVTAPVSGKIESQTTRKDPSRSPYKNSKIVSKIFFSILGKPKSKPLEKRQTFFALKNKQKLEISWEN